MDTGLIRKELTRYREELDKTERLRLILGNIVTNLEDLLSLDTDRQIQLTRVASDTHNASTRVVEFSIKGKISIQLAVVRVMRGLPTGAVLGTEEILSRIEALGARSDANDKLAVVDNACVAARKHGEPIERIATRRWRWNGATSRDTSNDSSGEDVASHSVTTMIPMESNQDLFAVTNHA